MAIGQTPLEAIYDAIADDDAYAQLSKVVATYVGASSAWIQESSSSGIALPSIHEFETDLVEPYLAHFHKVDPWLSAVERAPRNAPILCERYVSQKDYERSEFWNDLTRKHGQIFHCAGIVLPAAPIEFRLALQRKRGEAAFDGDTEARLTELLPHLRRFARTRARLARMRSLAALPERLLDAGSDAVALADHGLHVVYLNLAARCLLAAPDAPIRLGPGGCIEANRTCGAAFADGVRAAARLGGYSTCLQCEVDGARFSISIDPMPRARGQGPLAMIVVRNLRTHIVNQIEAARCRFGLTSAETLLAQSLLEGLTPQRHAAARGVKISTVRSQLRSVFLKTDTSNQPELVALIGSMATIRPCPAVR